MDELYRDQILEHYKRPHNFGRLESFDLDHEDTNPFCGDEQHVFIKLDDDGRVCEVGFEGQGCDFVQQFEKRRMGLALKGRRDQVRGRCLPRNA